ncbi:hypothetical protein [Endozoicomonas sp.]|nr:hypothetical protein [Endozoicomonas sp.]
MHENHDNSGTIVADFDGEVEYQESITKVKNLMSALEQEFSGKHG